MTMEWANQDKLGALPQEMRAARHPALSARRQRLRGAGSGRGRPGGRGRPLRAGRDQGRRRRRRWTRWSASARRAGPFADVYDLAGAAGHQGAQQAPAREPDPGRCAGRAGRATGGGWSRAPTRAALCRGRRPRRRRASQVSLFGGSGLAPRCPSRALPAVEDWPALERLQMEFDVLGLYLSAHPLDGYRTALERLGVTPGDRLRQVAAEGGRLRARRRRRQQAGAGDRAHPLRPPDRSPTPPPSSRSPRSASCWARRASCSTAWPRC